MPEPRLIVPYGDVRSQIRCGDLLLFRGRGALSRLISAAGRSPYTHAAMAAWFKGDVLMCLEMREFVGGRAVTLSSQVKRFPGQIDVFPLNETFLGKFYRNRAAIAMMRRAGHRYSYRGLLQASVLHLFGVRLIARPNLQMEVADDQPAFCSWSVSAAAAAGGVDPTPNLPHHLTEPGDLARSQLWSYRWTLAP